MPSWIRYGLIFAAAIVGAGIGMVIAGPLGAAAGVVPPTLLALWEAVQNDRNDRAFRRELARTRAIARTYDGVLPDDWVDVE